MAWFVAVVGVAVSLLTWDYAARSQAERTRSGFLSRAQTQVTVARQHLHNYQEMVYSLRDSFYGQQTVTRAEFANVADALLQRHRGVQALEWVKIVPDYERAELEQVATMELGRPFVIRRRAPDGTLQPSPPAPEYLVITYVAPANGNDAALGYDLTSGPTSAILDAARADGEFRVTQTFPLIQSSSPLSEPGVIFILPVARPTIPGHPIQGFVQGVFHVQTMLSLSHRLQTNEALDTFYIDITDPDSPQLLYANLAGQEPMRIADAKINTPAFDDPADVHTTLEIGKRRWLMIVRQNAAWTARWTSHQPELILFFGLTITILIAHLIQSMLERTSRIEQEVADRTRQLRATEGRLQAILDHSPSIIFVKDLKGRYRVFNQPFIDACPATIRPLLGRTDEELFPAAEAARYREHDELVLSSGHPAQFEEIATRPDGKVVTSLVQKFALLDEQGRPYAICGIATDITDHKAAEANKRLLERRLLESQKFESLGVLAGGVAHDFNNILTAILGNANLASLELPDDHPVRPQLRQIELASRRASDLCAQMLAYAGKAAFIISPVNLSALVRDTAALLEATVGRRVRLELSTADALPAIQGDATQIRQIVMNLVINAADAIGERTDGHIEVRTFAREMTVEAFADAVHSPVRRAGNYVGLEVTDNGGGMSPDVMKRIFEPFFTTKFSGRGLGLAAVLGIVQSHQGALFVESTSGKGTTFRLFFPASAGRAPEAAPVPASRPTPLQGTVLVVDDEPAVRSVALKALRAIGLEVIEAGDGQTGLQTFGERASDIDLVLLDLTMPGLSGEETLRQLRAKAPIVPVIVMSGYSEGETMGRCASLGVSGYLAKPFEVSDLVTRLRPYLNKLGRGTA
jgi:PAS domain S-box-containing protein